MTDHSPTPWYVLDEHLPGIESADDRSIVVYGADEPGDEAGVHGETPDQARANAAFIVKAVNSHDELVNDLADAVKLLHDLLGLVPGSSEAAFAFVERHMLGAVSAVGESK